MVFFFNRHNELSQDVQQAKKTFETLQKNLIDEIATLQKNHTDLTQFFLGLLTYIEDPNKDMIVDKNGQKSIYYESNVYRTLPTSEAKAKFKAFKQAWKHKNDLEKAHQYEEELKKLETALSQEQNDMTDLQASIQSLIPYIQEEAQKSYKTRYEMVCLIQSVRKLLDPKDENGIKLGIEARQYSPGTEGDYWSIVSSKYSINCCDTETWINKVPGYPRDTVLMPIFEVGIFFLGAASLFVSATIGISMLILGSHAVATAGLAALTSLIIGIGLIVLSSTLAFAWNNYAQNKAITSFSAQLNTVVFKRECYEDKRQKLEQQTKNSEEYQSQRDIILKSKATTNDLSLIQVVEAIEAAYGNTDLAKAYDALLLYTHEICFARTPNILDLHRASFLREHADHIELTTLVSKIVDSIQTSMKEKETTETAQLNDKFESKLLNLRS